jgi:hypothetical protein
MITLIKAFKKDGNQRECPNEDGKLVGTQALPKCTEDHLEHFCKCQKGLIWIYEISIS